MSTQLFAQNNTSPLRTSTHLISSFYHVGSYSKESPFLALEQTLDYQLKPKFRFGLGSGLNLYPATLTIPIYSYANLTIKTTNKLNIELLQSYGRNTKLGDLGFKSNRYVGQIIFDIHRKKKLSFAPQIGYLFNWDKWGGKSLSFLLGISIRY